MEVAKGLLCNAKNAYSLSLTYTKAGSLEESEKFSALICDLKNRIYMLSY